MPITTGHYHIDFPSELLSLSVLNFKDNVVTAAWVPSPNDWRILPDEGGSVISKGLVLGVTGQHYSVVVKPNCEEDLLPDIRHIGYLDGRLEKPRRLEFSSDLFD